MAFTRWDPLRDLLALHEQLGNLVGTDAPGWTPPVDLYETAEEIGPEALDKHFDELLEKQRNLISVYFTEYRTDLTARSAG